MSCPYYNKDCPKCNKKFMNMTPLEQFNEEVMKEFKEDYTTTKNHKFLGTRESVTIPIWNASPSDIQAFIIMKLTEHKALILKMVREKAEGSNGYGEFLDDLKTL